MAGGSLYSGSLNIIKDVFRLSLSTYVTELGEAGSWQGEVDHQQRVQVRVGGGVTVLHTVSGQ